MDRLLIRGGQPLRGEIAISGAKNAALPILCAALLTDEALTLHNVPNLHDVESMLELLQQHGVEVQGSAPTLTLRTPHLKSDEAPYDIVRKMRASILVLGPLLARFGSARVSLPGGCAIGARPVDQHIKGLQKLGADISIEHGYVNAKAKRLKGTRIVTDLVTVTGTENLMMAAVLADGETVIENAAREPEVSDLAHCLVAMGAKIDGIGSDRLVVQGVEKLHGATHSIIPDRIETGTFLCAAAATGQFGGSDLTLTQAVPSTLDALIDKLREAGANIEQSVEKNAQQGGQASGWLRVRADQRLQAINVRTAPYPAFPTDMQAQVMALNTIAHGSSLMSETIFENRFMHVPELMRLGADISIEHDTAVVKGVAKLSGASVMATDLRASASLVIAGLVAEGETTVNRIYHLDRGYDHMENKLRAVGADIERVK